MKVSEAVGQHHVSGHPYSCRNQHPHSYQANLPFAGKVSGWRECLPEGGEQVEEQMDNIKRKKPAVGCEMHTPSNCFRLVDQSRAKRQSGDKERLNEYPGRPAKGLFQERLDKPKDGGCSKCCSCEVCPSDPEQCGTDWRCIEDEERAYPSQLSKSQAGVRLIEADKRVSREDIDRRTEEEGTDQKVKRGNNQSHAEQLRIESRRTDEVRGELTPLWQVGFQAARQRTRVVEGNPTAAHASRRYQRL